MSAHVNTSNGMIELDQSDYVIVRTTSGRYDNQKRTVVLIDDRGIILADHLGDATSIEWYNTLMQKPGPTQYIGQLETL